MTHDQTTMKTSTPTTGAATAAAVLMSSAVDVAGGQPVMLEPGESATARCTVVAPVDVTVVPPSTEIPQKADDGDAGADADRAQPAKPASATETVSSVTAAFAARRRPTTDTPVVAVMLTLARMVPLNDE